MYTALKPKNYVTRLIDALIDKRIKQFGAIEICGTKWCGKSWTAAAFSESIVRVDENISIYVEDPSLALTGNTPHVIDEWQDVPSIWNIVRHRIDDQANQAGQFILTGSSTPPASETRHSGAGRIGRIRMHTMTLAETGESTGLVSLEKLFCGEFEPQKSYMGFDDLSKIICRGGWPALQNRGLNVDSKDVIDEYLDMLFDISLRKAGKNPLMARRIAMSLARNLGTSATLKTIALDTASGEQAIPTDETVSSYLSEFVMNYFLSELPGWDAPVKSKSRVRTKPKRYFADSSLGASLLGVNPERLLKEGQLFGALFESLCIHDLTVYAGLLPEASACPLHYYADSDGLKVDAIIELRDGRWAGIEIKLGESKVDEAAANLRRLRAKVAANPAARNPEPTFLAVLIGKGEYARQRKQDGIYVIPIDVLTA